MLYPSAKVIVRHKGRYDAILMVKRSLNSTMYYEPAGGKVDYNFETRIAESLEQCAIREAQEELGLFVNIIGYVGSYHFFWNIDPGKLSICALFEAVIVGSDSKFLGNPDSCEVPVEPVWVSTEDILTGKILIDSEYVGLEKLLKAYCVHNLHNKISKIYSKSS